MSIHNYKISIVIALYNNLTLTKQMLSSLFETLPVNIEYEIILVDDNSTDGTRDWLSTVQDTRIIKILNNKNFGYAIANNIGINQSSGDTICLLNNDILLSENWLEPMLNTLYDENLNAGIVGNIQYNPLSGTIDHAGITLSLSAKFEHLQQSPNPTKKHSEVIAATGACLLFRKDDFIYLNAFDESYVNGCEDIDLCYKFRSAGMSIFISNESTISHYVRSSRKKDCLQDEINSRILFNKWRKQIFLDLSALYYSIGKIIAYSDTTTYNNSYMPLELISSLCSNTVIRREENRWSHVIDNYDPNIHLPCHCKIEHYTHLYYDEILLKFDPSVLYLSDFYACGYRTSSTCKLSITISFNSCQTITGYADKKNDFNVGLKDPLLFNGSNTFIVRIIALSSEGIPVSRTGANYLISHFVIDNKEIPYIANQVMLD